MESETTDFVGDSSTRCIEDFYSLCVNCNHNACITGERLSEVGKNLDSSAKDLQTMLDKVEGVEYMISTITSAFLQQKRSLERELLSLDLAYSTMAQEQQAEEKRRDDYIQRAQKHVTQRNFLRRFAGHQQIQLVHQFGTRGYGKGARGAGVSDDSLFSQVVDDLAEKCVAGVVVSSRIDQNKDPSGQQISRSLSMESLERLCSDSDLNKEEPSATIAHLSDQRKGRKLKKSNAVRGSFEPSVLAKSAEARRAAQRRFPQDDFSLSKPIRSTVGQNALRSGTKHVGLSLNPSDFTNTDDEADALNAADRAAEIRSKEVDILIRKLDNSSVEMRAEELMRWYAEKHACENEIMNVCENLDRKEETHQTETMTRVREPPKVDENSDLSGEGKKELKTFESIFVNPKYRNAALQSIKKNAQMICLK